MIGCASDKALSDMFLNDPENSPILNRCLDHTLSLIVKSLIKYGLLAIDDKLAAQGYPSAEFFKDQIKMHRCARIVLMCTYCTYVHKLHLCVQIALMCTNIDLYSTYIPLIFHLLTNIPLIHRVANEMIDQQYLIRKSFDRDFLKILHRTLNILKIKIKIFDGLCPIGKQYGLFLIS